jgi:hypothetical protein
MSRHGHKEIERVKRVAAKELFAKKSWQVYDGKVSGTVITLNNRIVSAPPEFRRFVGQLLATLPIGMKVAASEVVNVDGREPTESAD